MMKEGSVPIPCIDKKGIRLKLVSLYLKTHSVLKEQRFSNKCSIKKLLKELLITYEKQIRKKLIFVLFLYSYRVLLYMRSLMPFDSMTWICYIVYLKRYFSYLIAANLGPSQTRFKLIYI